MTKIFFYIYLALWCLSGLVMCLAKDRVKWLERICFYFFFLSVFTIPILAKFWL